MRSFCRSLVAGLWLCFITLCNVQVSQAAPSPAAVCIDPPQRLEWKNLSLAQKASYTGAVQCLTTKAAISGITGAVNRFDDHMAVHSEQTPAIHWVGHFILWHRYFVATYETALRQECGYEGGQPYWDWSQDADPQNLNSTAIYETNIFDPLTGFGGNGSPLSPTPEQNPLNITGGTGGGCVVDGPFSESSGFTVNFPTPGCLKRDFVPWIMNSFANPALVDKVMHTDDYTAFATAIEGTPSFTGEGNIHGSGHFGVGGVLGTIGDPANSPGDPLFYLHHGNLDRIFWEWQQRDPAARLNEVGGPVKPFDYGGENVTLEFEIEMGRLAGSVTLKDLLDTRGGTLCYTY